MSNECLKGVFGSSSFFIIIWYNFAKENIVVFSFLFRNKKNYVGTETIVK